MDSGMCSVEAMLVLALNTLLRQSTIIGPHLVETDIGLQHSISP